MKLLRLYQRIQSRARIRMERTATRAMSRVRKACAGFANTRRNTRDLWIGLPALIIFLCAVIATVAGYIKQSSNATKYLALGQQSLEQGDAEAAQVYLLRAMDGDRVDHRKVMFLLARSYDDLGKGKRANELLLSLAPAGTVGYAPAHRYLAIKASEHFADARQIDDLDAWHWHLTHAGPKSSPPLKKAWGYYFMAANETEEAIRCFQQAAEEEPALWLIIAELEFQSSEPDDARLALAFAKYNLGKRFHESPEDDQSRLMYATSLYHSGDLHRAEALIQGGLEQKADNTDYWHLLAAIYDRWYATETQDMPQTGHEFPHMLWDTHHEIGAD